MEGGNRELKVINKKKQGVRYVKGIRVEGEGKELRGGFRKASFYNFER